MDERWQREPLLLARGDPRHFHNLISLEEFGAIVASTGLRHPYFRVFKEGTPLTLAQTTSARQLGPDLDTGLADLNTLYDEYAAGGTIVLQALERWWPSFRHLCRDCEIAFGFPTQAHAYLTPQSAQGAPVHYDTHDVFVLQVEGTKRWRVWEPIKPLPLRMSEDRYEPEAVAEHTASTPPLLDAELREGDSLYLPRGYIHDVRTGQSRSLHVTISVMMYRWVDLADAAVAQRLAQASESEAFRRSIPFGRTPFSQPDVGMRETYQALVDALVEGLDLTVGLRLIRDRLATYASPSLRGRLLDIERLHTLDSEQYVIVRGDVIVTHSDGAAGMTLIFGRARETFEPRFRLALEHILSSRKFRPCDLPDGLQEGEQLALTRRLVLSGLCSLRDEADP